MLKQQPKARWRFLLIASRFRRHRSRRMRRSHAGPAPDRWWRRVRWRRCALASDSFVKNEPEQGYVMAEHNADQVTKKGQSGELWVVHQARLDARLAVFGQAAIEAAAPATGERVLDV